MIYVDWSYLVTCCYFAQEKVMGEVTEGDFRKHVIHTLIQIQNRFRHQYGSLVACCDGKRSWRYEHYPHYKALRKLQRADDAVKWQEVERLNRMLREEIKKNNVFKIVMVPHAEGDDVIAILSTTYLEPSLIVSEDKDYHQLHKHSHIKQYSHRREQVYASLDPHEELKEKIIRGDRNDSIPNIHSKDEVFILKERQTVVSAKRYEVYSSNFFIGEGGIPEEFRKHFERNKRLIDFAFIPEAIRTAILEEFNRPSEKVMFGSTYRTLYLVQAGINPAAF